MSMGGEAASLRSALARLADGETLSAAEAEAAFSALMDGDAEDAQIGAFLMGLRVRGESVEEIIAGARAMRARASGIEAAEDIVDTCGTGGDGAHTFNISTAAAIVAAGAGAKVAKHGNRAVSSKSGSSDVLAALGVNIECGPDIAARCVAGAGIGFLFAPAHHSAMRHVAGARRALGLRTIFNLLGPLSNPAGARRQLVGVYDRALIRPMAEALKGLGAQKAWVVHGRDGLDEITTTDSTDIAALEDGAVREFALSPDECGLQRARPEDLAGGDAQANADAITALLNGAPGAFRDIVVLNAAAALVVADLAEDVQAGAARAAASIDGGAAREALSQLVAISNSTA